MGDAGAQEPYLAALRSACEARFQEGRRSAAAQQPEAISSRLLQAQQHFGKVGAARLHDLTSHDQGPLAGPAVALCITCMLM